MCMYKYLLDGNAIKVVNCSSYCAVYLRVHVRKSEAMRWSYNGRLPTKCARTRSPRAGDCQNESVRSRTSCRVASQERKAERLNEEWLPGLRLRCGVRGLTKMSRLNAAKMAQKRPFDGLQPRHRENKDRVVTFHNQTCQGRNRPGLVHLSLDELREASKPFVPPQTKCNSDWVYKTFLTWCREHNTAVESDHALIFPEDRFTK